MRIVFLTLAALVAVNQNAFADATQIHAACGRTKGGDIVFCAQSIDQRGVLKDQRLASMNACLASAKVAKLDCISATNICLTTCQNNVLAARTQCQTDFNIAQCGTDADCVNHMTTSYNKCLTVSQEASTSCAQGCQ